MLRWTLLRCSESRWLRDRVPEWRIARGAVRRFLPGETLEDALRASRTFQEKGMGNILTYLGENVATEEETETMTCRYLEALSAVSGSGTATEISVKLTQLGLDQSPELCHRNMVRIADHAMETGNFVWIDMEASVYVEPTLEQFRRLRSSYSNVGLCLQAYLYRTEKDLASLLPLSPAIRLVKGAYAEPKIRAYPKKLDVDANFLRLARSLLAQRSADRSTRPAFATHDATLISALGDAAQDAGVEKGGYEFQLLYGIQRAEQDRLAEEGHQVRVLISYGNAWFPWFMRRLAERPRNLLFVVKNIFD